MSLPSAKKLMMCGSVNRVDDYFAVSVGGGAQGESFALPFAPELVWSKSRALSEDHFLFDTIRGRNQRLATNLSDPNSQTIGPFSYGPDGISKATGPIVSSPQKVAWSFRRTKKFFDMVTYVGNDQATRQIAHSLGTRPGFIVIKCYTHTTGWSANGFVGAAVYNMRLDQDFPVNASQPRVSACDAATFTVDGTAGDAEVNTSGRSYVAYIFADDPSPRGSIRCGTYDGNRSSSARLIGVGWEPQFTLIKPVSGSFGAGNWYIHDNKRTANGYADKPLYANTRDAESGTGAELRYVPAGFEIRFQGAGLNNENTRYFYMAIRKGKQ